MADEKSEPAAVPPGDGRETILIPSPALQVLRRRKKEVEDLMGRAGAQFAERKHVS